MDTGFEADQNKIEKDQTSFLDSKVLHMMKMMGYKSGLGLGKNQQGLTSPIEIKPQFGKRGLGLDIKKSNEEWDFSLEDTKTVEEVEWLTNTEPITCTEQTFKAWLKEGSRKKCVDDEYNFCDKQTLHNVLNAKNIFEELDLKELNQARARANPFETIRSVFFMNRAALKMANIDAATGFMFTNIDQSEHHKKHSGPYYFADVCAGPGGFTEYILWRKKWLFKGFGLTLKESNDFKVAESLCACPITFMPFYGSEGDGNVCCPANIDDFKEKVLHETENEGVHFMMSDGGFSVEGNENMQEVLSKNIYVCQCLVSLEILRQHGHFVTKIFDVFTTFSVGLIYLMYNCFEKICILKPNSSRPANAERYLICYNFQLTKNMENIRSYFRKIVQRLWELKDDSERDITEIVPLDIMKSSDKFFHYIYNSNNKLAKRQTLHLKKLATFCRNYTLFDHRQDKLRQECLDHWKIPDRPKISPSRFSVEDLLATVDERELLLVFPREVASDSNLNDFISDVNEWHYVPMQCKKEPNICNFYAGVRYSKVYRLQRNKWVKVKNMQLSCGTLLYGELVKEQCIPNSCISDPETHQYKYSLHVIDALRLGDVSLANLKFEERINLIATFCKAVNHEFRPKTVRIRPKEIYGLPSICTNFHLRQNHFQSNYLAPLPVLGYKIKEECYEVNSILLLKTSEDQSFHSTYVLRIQLFISEVKENMGMFFPVENVVQFVNHELR